MIPKSRTAGSTHTHRGKDTFFFKLFTCRSKPSSVLLSRHSSTLCVYGCRYSYLFVASQQSYEVGTVTIPVEQTWGKPEHREVRWTGPRSHNYSRSSAPKYLPRKDFALFCAFLHIYRILICIWNSCLLPLSR